MIFPKATKIALLQSKFHRITKHQMTKALKPFGLSTVEWIILGYLNHKSSALSPSSVAEEVGIQDSFLTVLAAKMEKRGLIKITHATADKRKKNIQISKEGKKLLPLSQNQFVLYFTPLLKGLDMKDLTHFLLIIKKIIKNFESAEK